MKKITVLILCLVGICTHSISYAFSFSEEEEQEKAQAVKATKRIKRMLAVPCAAELKNKTIALMIGEYGNHGRVKSVGSSYGMHFQMINTRLRKLGLKTMTQVQITERVAQEEMEAVLNNDPDAALSAAERLGAQFILRGVIRARSRVNPIVRTNEVFVNMGFSLSGSDGRPISDVSASGDSWAGMDTLSISLDIVREQAGGVVARLYRDYCTSH